MWFLARCKWLLSLFLITLRPPLKHSLRIFQNASPLLRPDTVKRKKLSPSGCCAFFSRFWIPKNPSLFQSGGWRLFPTIGSFRGWKSGWLKVCGQRNLYRLLRFLLPASQCPHTPRCQKAVPVTPCFFPTLPAVPFFSFPSKPTPSLNVHGNTIFFPLLEGPQCFC